jgi:hypothetical protein
MDVLQKDPGCCLPKLGTTPYHIQYVMLGIMVSCRFSLSGAPDFFHEISNVEPGKMARLRRGGGAGE